MALYSCKLGMSDGKIVERDMESATLEALRESLEEQGFFIFEIRKKPLQFLFDKGVARRKVGADELLTFNQEFLVLIKAGMPILQALDTILEKSEKGKLSDVLRLVREDIVGGTSLSDAFDRHPRAFSPLYVASVRAGERTGDLPKSVRRYIAFLKRTVALKKKFLSALFYPSILVTVAIMAVTLLLVYVVPTFSRIYADAGSALPVPTQILIACTTFLKRYFFLFILAVIIAVIGIRQWATTPAGSFRVDVLKLRIPFIGPTFNQYSLASFIRTFGTVLGSGIPVVQAMRMSVGTLNNKLLERKVLAAVTRVEEGTRLSTALEGTGIFPPMALRMLGVGESTGALEEMLMDIADYFEEQIEGRLHILTTAVEPAIMIVMGLIIGAIVITMYLPVFKLAGTAGG